MKRFNILWVGFAILLMAAAYLGCSDSGINNANDSPEFPQLMSIFPADGAAGISIHDSLHLRFNMPMDSLSVRHGLHLSGGQEMHGWMDSLGHYGDMDQMHMNTQNHMMNWMDSIQWQGQFYWNTNRDSCVFVPDSSLWPETDYMIMIVEKEIMGHNGHGMHMGHNDDGYHYFHFTTGN